MQKFDRKKIIWVLLPNLKVGGAEIFLTSLASQLSAQFHFVFLVNDSGDKLQHLNQTVYTHKNSIQFTFRLVRLAWQQRPDIILSSIIDINLLSLLVKRVMPRKTKHIVREALPLREACNLSRAPKLYLWLATRLYPGADAIVNLSTPLLKSLQKTIPAIIRHPKTVVIPNGVGNDRVLAQPPKNYCATKIVSIGRLEHQKGFDVLINAFGRFHSENPKYHLKIIGSGSQRSYLQTLILQTGKSDVIELCGSLEEPIHELSSAAFFVLPSRYEGLSNAMLEALVNGVPVLATAKDTSARDVVTKKDGILIDYCDEEKILKGLRVMDANLSSFERDSIAVSAREKFGIKKSAEKYAELISDILNNE